MDQKLATLSLRTAGTLALAAAAVWGACPATAADANGHSTIALYGADARIAAPPEDTLLVISDADDSTAPPKFIKDSAFTPAAAEAPVDQQGESPAWQRLVGQPVLQDARSVVAAPAREGSATPAAPTAAQLLLQAHEVSQQATNETHYSAIITKCAAAQQMGVEGEAEEFSRRLSAWALNRRGEHRADQGQDALALADFRTALELDSNCWRAYHNRSVSYAQLGQFAESFDDVCHVIQLNPDFAKAYSNRATLYVQAGDSDRAIADYDLALQRQPTLMAALVGRGRLLHLEGRLDEALQDFTTAIDNGAEQADVYCSRADLLADLGKYQLAMQDYARAIDADLECEHAYRNGAWLLATCPDPKIRDAEAAVAGARRALECGYGERHAALDTLAAALANAGNFAEAVGVIEQAIEIAPEELRDDYQVRKQLYEAGQPFRAEPVDAVEAAEFVAEG